jgi:hypothetical protein
MILGQVNFFTEFAGGLFRSHEAFEINPKIIYIDACEPELF